MTVMSGPWWPSFYWATSFLADFTSTIFVWSATVTLNNICTARSSLFVCSYMYCLQARLSLLLEMNAESLHNYSPCGLPVFRCAHGWWEKSLMDVSWISFVSQLRPTPSHFHSRSFLHMTGLGMWLSCHRHLDFLVMSVVTKDENLACTISKLVTWSLLLCRHKKDGYS